VSNPGQLIGELPVRLQPSHAQLAAETSLSRRTVIDALESLRVRGYVTWISGARDSRRNLYTLHIPDAAAVVVPLRPRRRTAVEDQTKAQVR
jgi:DNA-binding transcriptional MocR family regulator